MACILNRSPYERGYHNSGDYRPCYPWQCKTCGWNPVEAERRRGRKLVLGKNGLRHIVVKLNRRWEH